MNVYGRYGNYIPKGIKHIVEKIPVAKCDRKYDKGDTIIVETHRDRYQTVWSYLGEENGKPLYGMKKKRLDHHYCTVWNYLGEENGDYLYSITRTNYKKIKNHGAFIPLSMPESIQYYKKELHEATILYEGMKSGHITHQESAAGNFSKIDYFSFYWAKRMQKELTEKYRLAKKLWGNNFVNNDSSSYKIAKKCGKNLNYHKFITDSKEITQEFLGTLAA